MPFFPIFKGFKGDTKIKAFAINAFINSLIIILSINISKFMNHGDVKIKSVGHVLISAIAAFFAVFIIYVIMYLLFDFGDSMIDDDKAPVSKVENKS